MPGARWFPGAEVNYAAHALRSEPLGPALVGLSQSRERVELSMDELRDQVARCRAGLAALGVGRGDRVAAYLRTSPRRSSPSSPPPAWGRSGRRGAPEFGTRSVVDRWRQIEPAVLLAVDGYRYGAKAIGRKDEVAAIRTALPSLRATVTVPYLEAERRQPARHDGSVLWDDLLGPPGPGPSGGAAPEFEPLPFDHPLYVLYSSGTTGLPKAIVHGHGGILVEHHKVLAMHSDLGPGDRFFWFSTTGWMMWNYLVSGLLVGATPVLFDGDPGHPGLDALWRMAADEGVTFFGTSAPFLLACRKAGVEPGAVADLSALRVAVGSTGAPLPAEGFEWVYEAVKGDVLLSSISGGSDVCTAFVGGCPLFRCGRARSRAATWAPGSRPTTRRAGRWWGSRASWSSPPRCRRCRSGSGATRTGRASGAHTSSVTPGCGLTATGSPCTPTGPA